MSRAGYCDGIETWSLIRWRGAVKSALKGKRGQQALREIAAAMDAMPEKALIAKELEVDGQYCTLGVLGAARGIEMSLIDPYDEQQVSEKFGLAEAMVREIEFMNDEGHWGIETPEQRWMRMRKWVDEQIDTSGEQTKEREHG